MVQALTEFTADLAIIDRLDLEPTAAARLKSLGVFEGQRIELARRGSPLVIKAAGSRIAIAAALAGQILVRPLDQ